MKKLLFTTLYLVSVIAFNVPTFAQEFAYNKNRISAAHPYPEKESKIVNESDVNVNAVRDFSKNFRKATAVKWVKNDNGASVYFAIDGVKMRTSYNTKGRREYTLKYYNESGLPADIRHLVRSTYYDYRIAIATEVVRNEHVSYLIKMENDKEFMTVKVDDGDLSVFERTTKGN